MIYPIVLCGGSGTRLWPLSRQSYPKQFARLAGEESLFQASARRLAGPDFAAPLIVTGDALRFVVTEQLAQVAQAPKAILIEPAPRNTAPAVLAGVLAIAREDPEALVLIVPSDHLIPDIDAFQANVAAAVPAARAGKVVTFGIQPTRAETAYGYLELTADAQSADQPSPLARFVEKPDEARAQAMLEAGNFLWNAGLFLFSVQTILEAYKAHAPDMLTGVSASVDGSDLDLGFTRLAAAPWEPVEDISVDYAIMEKLDNLAVMPFGGNWTDLGDWDTVWRETPQDENGNACSTQATAIACENSLLRTESDGIELVGIGLQNIVAVAMNDAVLVADRSHAQQVRSAVTALKTRDAPQAVEQARTYRPWGWYESLVVGDRFQVKRIYVHAGAALSLQSHHHRSEHWIVVEGTAQVTIGDDVQLVSENQSVYVPLGTVHRIENPGKLPITLIEVQTGGYLGEDDIVRYEDRYARD
ncbi:mannose-1-phosphate guanylyltransferase/mannose-6-phosphate isomerase [Tateyamaria sp. SN3-11]|uniref:mannose-1-phosphate guanylyltransferase/mannose-6-phosphate isomerase n=1 Tax=Tateyamaria sp. SN3-11 TaxID=3092147 RepID=UPI0039EA42DA